LPEVEMTCGRVVIINKGKVVAQDSPENLTRRLKGTEKVIVEIGGKEADARKVFQGFSQISKWEPQGKPANGRLRYAIETTAEIRGDLSRAIVENNLALYELHAETYSLEDIFLHLTTEEEVA